MCTVTMKNTTSAVCCLLLAVLICAPLVRACDDSTEAEQCATAYTSAIAGLTDHTQICPHLTTYRTCLTTACGSSITANFQSALDAAIGAVYCSGVGNGGGGDSGVSAVSSSVAAVMAAATVTISILFFLG